MSSLSINVIFVVECHFCRYIVIFVKSRFIYLQLVIYMLKKKQIVSKYMKNIIKNNKNF